MKTKRTILAAVLLIAVAIVPLATSCKSTKTLPDGTTVRVYDEQKTANVKAAIEPLLKSTLRRTLAKSPQHKEQIGNYLRAVGSVFCQMKAENRFDPAFLISSVDTATAGLQVGVDPLILDLKDGAIALYKINFNGRFNAELPPDQWPIHVADLLCGVIDGGLKDSGLPGVR